MHIYLRKYLCNLHIDIFAQIYYNKIVEREKVKADVKRKPTRNDQIRRGQDCRNLQSECRQHRAPTNLNPYGKKESAPHSRPKHSETHHPKGASPL